MTRRKANPLKPWATVDPMDRLLRRLTYDHGCWLWTGTKDRAGYGIMHGVRGERGSRAHRVAYKLFVSPVSDGLHIDHLCRNTSCCNPLHLEAVTCQENVQRGASYRGNEGTCVHGHAFTDENTAWRTHYGRMVRTCKACSRARERKARAEKRWKRKPTAERPYNMRKRAAESA